jgi:hypothetical protein
MPNLSATGNYAQIASVIIPLIGGLWATYRRIDKKQMDHQMFLQRLSDKIDVITAQFGPNGGGLRQAVNEMSRKIDKIEERQIVIGEKVARLQGEFEQHIEGK